MREELSLLDNNMIKKFFNKVIPGTLIIAILAGSISFATIPRPVHAVITTQDVGANSFISSLGSMVRTGLQTSLNLKEFTLDAIAYAIAKQILRQIVSETVNWINSGFEGNPAFLSDPAGFFLGIGDELLGKFLESMELTNFLCSPFSIDVRIAIAFRYRPFSKRVPSCTLTSVIRNSQNAIEGANINGFTAGDFRQGGWPAFVSMTTEPQNNQYGAFIEADNELSIRIGNKTLLKQNDLLQGKGFLSWEKCTDIPMSNGTNSLGPVQNTTPAPTASEELGFIDRDLTSQAGTAPGVPSNYVQVNAPLVPQKKCETQTPGSVISGQLETTLGSPIRELELADEINEIMNALFAQLIKQVLIGGLRAATGQGPSDPDSVINRLQQQQVTSGTQLSEIKSSILLSIDRYINQARQYKTDKERSLKYGTDTKAQLDSVKACFAAEMTEVRPQPLQQQQRDYASSTIAYADALINVNVASTTSRLYSDLLFADNQIARLTTIKSTVTSATTVNEISPLANEYNLLIATGAVIDEGDMAHATAEYDTVRTDMDPIRLVATRMQQACALFPAMTTIPALTITPASDPTTFP